MRIPILPSAALLLVYLLPSWGQAQAVPRSSPVSPFINLGRRDVNPAINYYGLVRPQIQFSNSIQGLQNQVSSAEAQGLAGTDFTGAITPTGLQHAQFQSHTKYFLNTGVSAPGRRQTSSGFSPTASQGGASAGIPAPRRPR